MIPSIDLRKAIEKIASRQSLNDVHFLIALVRKSLTLGAHDIDIHHKRGLWNIQHNGNPPSHDEIKGLLELLNGTGTLDQLNRQEQLFSMAYLTVLVTMKEVVLRWENECLQYSDGRWRINSNSSRLNTTCLTFIENSKPVGDPKQELAFFCRNPAAKILFNRTAIPSIDRTPPLLLQATWETAEGKGLIGIPWNHQDSCFQFLKHGILFGTRHVTPITNGVLFGWWDSCLENFEPDFKKSIQIGSKELTEKGKYIYKQIPGHFNSLDKNSKARLRNLILNVPVSNWEPEFRELNLFQWGHTPFSISLKEIDDLTKTALSLPYSIGKPKENAVHLNEWELHILRDQLQVPVRFV